LRFSGNIYILISALEMPTILRIRPNVHDFKTPIILRKLYTVQSSLRISVLWTRILLFQQGKTQHKLKNL